MWVGAVASAGAVALTPLVLGKVHASDGEPRTMKPNQLPIYEESSQLQFEFVEEKDTFLHSYIQKMRVKMGQDYTVVQHRADQLCTAIDAMKDYANEWLVKLQQDNGEVSRAAFITVAGLGGMVIGYKRGVWRRSLYVSSAMIAATSIAYPKQTVDIVKTGWAHSSTLARTTWENRKSNKASVEDSKEESSNSTNAEKAEKVSNTLEATSDAASNDKQHEDHGMSNPADKDLYTTRGS